MRMQAELPRGLSEKLSQPERTSWRQRQWPAPLNERVCFIASDPNVLLKRGIVRLEIVVMDRPINNSRLDSSLSPFLLNAGPRFEMMRMTTAQPSSVMNH